MSEWQPAIIRPWSRFCSAHKFPRVYGDTASKAGSRVRVRPADAQRLTLFRMDGSREDAHITDDCPRTWQLHPEDATNLFPWMDGEDCFLFDCRIDTD